MSPQEYFFVSYRSLERSFAATLVADLKNSGFHIWMDRFEIKGGDNWDKALETGLDQCSAVIAIISPAYLKSEICRSELLRAYSRGVPIFPVLLEPLPDNKDWPIIIQARQYVDFSHWQEPGVYRQQLDALLATLHEKFAGEQGLPPDPEIQYLNSLIATLEARQSVLEYVELDALADEPELNTVHDPYEQAFEVLLEVKPGGAGTKTTRLYRAGEVVGEQNRLVLLGEPGAGKTTTLQRIALETARARLSQPESTALPWLVSLGQWQKQQSFDDFLSQSWPLPGKAGMALSSGHVLLLLDGLNEMGDAGQSKAEAIRLWLEAQSEAARIVITCRSHEYQVLKLGETPTAQLRELSENQIRQFAGKLLQARAGGFLEQVLLPPRASAQDARRAISNLAHTPFFLRAFVALYLHSPTDALPSNTGDLFSRLARAMWSVYEKRAAHLRPASWATAKAHLEEFALWAIENQSSEDLPTSTVLEKLGDDVFRPAVEANLIEVNGNYARFYHSLFRSYFAAEALTKLPDAASVKEWCRRNLGYWEEVVVAWSGISPLADEFLAQIHWEEAADILARGFQGSDRVVRDRVAPAVQELEYSSWRDFQPAMDALIRIGRPAVPLLIEELSSDDPEMRAKTAFVLGRIGDPRSVSGLVKLLDDPNGDARSRARSALLDIGDSQGLEALSNRLDNLETKNSAIIAIGRLAPKNGVELLLPLLDDQNIGVRVAAVNALGMVKDPRAAAGLKERLADQDVNVRKATAKALGSLGGTAVLDALVEAVLDTDKDVREQAITALAETQDIRAVPVFIRSLGDESIEVRSLAVQALGATGDPKILPHLIATLHDRDGRVRQAAVRALGNMGLEAAREPLLELLRSNDQYMWKTVAETLKDVGWYPHDPADQVKFHVGLEDWSAILAMGEAAVPELRRILGIVDDRLRSGISSTLQKLDWEPKVDDPGLLNYYMGFVDWQAVDRQSNREPLYLPGWIGQQELHHPLRIAVSEMLFNIIEDIPLGTLMKALESDELAVRHFATVAAAMSFCDEALPVIVENLNADTDYAAFEYGPIRVASALALGEIRTFSSVYDLLNHIISEIPSGTDSLRDVSALAAGQAIAQLVHLPNQIFGRIPASSLGRISKEDPFDLWGMFYIGDNSVLDQYSISAMIEALSTMDRSEVPPMWGSTTAFLELHRRLTVLTLLCVATMKDPDRSPETELSTLAMEALRHIWSVSAIPVLREVEHWGTSEIQKLAKAELRRLK